MYIHTRTVVEAPAAARSSNDPITRALPPNQSASRSPVSRANSGRGNTARRPPRPSDAIPLTVALRPAPAKHKQSVAAAAAATIGGPSPTVTSNGPEFQIQNRQRSSAAPPRLVAVVRVALNDYLHTRKQTCPGVIFFLLAHVVVWLVTEHKSENATTTTTTRTHVITPTHGGRAMVLQDVNGNGKKPSASSAVEQWLRQRVGQQAAATAARCIFGPTEKRAHMAVVMRNEAEMDRKRAEFAARYEPMGLSSSERRGFYDGLLASSSSSSSSPSPPSSPSTAHNSNHHQRRFQQQRDNNHLHGNKNGKSAPI